ncbi:MAG: MAPEG family protein [Pseudomonadota bacterium]
MPLELTLLAVSGIIFVIHLLTAAGGRTVTYGLDWAAGPRDTHPGQVPQWGERADRAFRNMAETFPLYAAFSVAVVAADATGPLTALGASLYVVGRVLYLPAYLLHIQFVRSLIWVAAMVGIALLGAPLILGAL